MEAIEGPVELLECLGDNSCTRMSNCPTRYLWEGLERCIIDYLSSKTLHELIGHFLNTGKTFEGMYI
jgi:DNA-binding IscR family transcriptional regulator